MLKKVGDGISNLKGKIFQKGEDRNKSVGQNDNQVQINEGGGQVDQIAAENHHQQAHNQSGQKFIQEDMNHIGIELANPNNEINGNQMAQANQGAAPKKKGIINNVQQKIQEGRTAISAAVKNAIGQVNDIRSDVVQEYRKLGDKSAQVISKQKESFNDWSKLKAEEAILKILRNQKPRLKRYLTDPHMFKVVKEIIHDMVDDNWPELEEYIRQQLRTSILSNNLVLIEEKAPDVFCLMQPWYQLRRWYLYTTYPYNKSMWHTIRSWSWWFFLLIKLFPLYGVQSYLHVVFFLMIDKSDEWQLLSYIVSFKRLQFFSFGAAGSFIGYAMFFNCATLNDYVNADDYYRCKTEGPGSKINLVSDIIGFLIQVGFCWLSFLMIPCSITKGEFKYQKSEKDQKGAAAANQNEKEANQQKKDEEALSPLPEEHRAPENQICCFTINAERGGRIKCFLVYDLIVFSICLAMMLIVLYAFDKTQEDWQKYQLIYLIKTFYGFLNLPWLIFLFSPMLNLLTTARETGYDRFGITQRMHVDYSEKKKEMQLKEEKIGLLNKEMNLGELVVEGSNQNVEEQNYPIQEYILPQN